MLEETCWALDMFYRGDHRRALRIIVQRDWHSESHLGHHGWARFTPLQEWREHIELLLCVPEGTVVPHVGKRVSEAVFHLYM